MLNYLGKFKGLQERLRDVPATMPTQYIVNRWLQGNLSAEIFRKSIRAVEWDVADRGLAGLGDLQGLPRVLSMDQFFEATQLQPQKQRTVQKGPSPVHFYFVLNSANFVQSTIRSKVWAVNTFPLVASSSFFISSRRTPNPRPPIQAITS